jgi:hypothetical protein
MLKKIVMNLREKLVSDGQGRTSRLGKLAFLGLLFLGVCVHPLPAQSTVWVSPDGSDLGTGSEAAPYRTLSYALREVREWRRLGDERVLAGAQIVMRGGRYELAEPVLVRPEDSGTAAAPTVIRAAGGELPIISGGREVSDWRLVEDLPGLPEAALGKVWVADAPAVGGWPTRIRDLWVGGKRATPARDSKGTDFRRLLAWDKTAREGWIEWPEELSGQEIGHMEMIVHQMWAIAILRVKELERVGDRGRVTFLEPESRVQFEHPWPPVVISDDGNSAYYLSRHPAFLDEPGEWYQSSPDGKIYYWPREGEQPDETTAMAPVHPVLLQVDGSVDHPVRHVYFEGIQFSHTTWMRPSHAGHVPLQAGMYLLDAYKLKIPGTPDKAGLENQAWVGRKPAAVQVRHSESLRFTECRFEHLAASGLDFIVGGYGDVVEGCLFRDIGGNGLVAGTFQEGGIETHLPYDPADERVLCRDLTIRNNLVTDVANTDWGCVGIIAAFVRGITIEHNVINNVSYSGISLGWGWTKSVNTMRNNRVLANHIHHYGKQMYDTGGIYTLSPQPKSVIAENRVHSIYRPDFVHDPNHWSYIYLDEGSSYFIVRDNWTEGTKYSTNANGPGNTWENNGPEVSQSVVENAGLEPAFAHLLELSTVEPEASVVP